MAGQVTALDSASPKCAAFSIGDEVMATWGGVLGEGGMAEYALVAADTASHLPSSIPPVQAAALVNSAAHALSIVRAAAVCAGDRVLVLGGSGGVGHVLVQLARHAGAEYVAATSTDAEMLVALGVHRVVDYRTENWWAVPEFVENKFDVIVDCAIGLAAWTQPCLHDVLKTSREGGRFVAVVINEWHVEMNSLLEIPAFMLSVLWRQVSSRFYRSKPNYTAYLGSVIGALGAEVLQLVKNGHLKVVLHEGKTFSFTEQGAKDAFNLLISRRAHGKVVMQISTTS